MVYDVKVKIKIKYDSYSFYYSYNYKSTFQDLLEYISYLFPELEICQCYEFQIANSNRYYYDSPKIIKIENDCPIRRYSEHLSELELIDKKKNYFCAHYDKNYLKISKSEIISLFQKEIDKLQSNYDNQNEKLKI